MTRIILVVCAALLTSTAVAEAQNSPATKWFEFGVDMAAKRTPQHELLQQRNAPWGVRTGVITSEHRFTLDQRVTLDDRRLVDSPNSWQIETQLGWRLGSRARVERGAMGPYMFGAFNLSNAANHFRDADAPNRAMFGYAGGVGTRVNVKGFVLRPELFLGYDPGARARGDTFWIPGRSSFGLRFGYGFHAPIASD